VQLDDPGGRCQRGDDEDHRGRDEGEQQVAGRATEPDPPVREGPGGQGTDGGGEHDSQGDLGDVLRARPGHRDHGRVEGDEPGEVPDQPAGVVAGVVPDGRCLRVPAPSWAPSGWLSRRMRTAKGQPPSGVNDGSRPDDDDDLGDGCGDAERDRERLGSCHGREQGRGDGSRQHGGEDQGEKGQHGARAGVTAAQGNQHPGAPVRARRRPRRMHVRRPGRKRPPAPEPAAWRTRGPPPRPRGPRRTHWRPPPPPSRRRATSGPRPGGRRAHPTLPRRPTAPGRPGRCRPGLPIVIATPRGPCGRTGSRSPTPRRRSRLHAVTG